MVATVADEGRVTALESCLACGDGELKTYIDLGAQPLANDFHSGDVALGRFPLAVNVCGYCFHSQLTHAVDPELLYRNYLYVSGTTKTLLTAFDEFVDRVENEFPGRRLRVLDIASNDGTLLSRFACRGHHVQGVDPAENLAPLSEANGVSTMVGYWGAATASALGQDFDVVVAMNVLGHVPDPEAFLAACGTVLAPEGRLYVQTSQCEMVRRFEFDTIYHEHHSFFTARSFRTLTERCGLTVLEADKVPVHGTSYLWTVVQGEDRRPDASVERLLADETEHGYYAQDTYERFGRSVRETLAFVEEAVRDHRARGYVAVGYGAAAKGNTLLNAAGLDLDYIVDDNPLKIGLTTPGRDIPIVPVEALGRTQEPLCVLVLAWNFFDEIRARIAAQRERSDDAFVQYFPERVVHTA